MAFKIKRVKVKTETYHIGTWPLPSDHAISAHATVTTGQPPKWIYSEDPATLKPEDRAYWESAIRPTLHVELNKKLGENRHRARALAVQTKRTLR